MGLSRDSLPADVMDQFRRGGVLPAHPLALDEQRRLDSVRQRALTRYYLDAGAHGLAVGVHTTQFGIRKVGLFEPVLKLAAETARDWRSGTTVLIAGVTGDTTQAVSEAEIALRHGYHAALVNLAGLRNRTEEEVLAHCRKVAKVMPVLGFALLPTVGGRHFSYRFWRGFSDIENVVGIKVATFDRYRTLEVVRAVADAQAAERITLYTGNDDHILLDLLTPFPVRQPNGEETVIRFRGGLLGHWSVWTRSAVRLFERTRTIPDGAPIPAELLALDARVTDCNAAIYDAAHDLRGCIPGCLEVLRRQGLLRGTWCLDPNERLSDGQVEEIDRVYRLYPELNDDAFVRSNLTRWLSDDGVKIPLFDEEEAQ